MIVRAEIPALFAQEKAKTQIEAKIASGENHGHFSFLSSRHND
jgi:hypothetical protein